MKDQRLWQAFSPSTKQAWWDQITQELKDQAKHSLYWEWEDQLLPPVWGPEDLPVLPQPLRYPVPLRSWKYLQAWDDAFAEAELPAWEEGEIVDFWVPSLENATLDALLPCLQPGRGSLAIGPITAFGELTGLMQLLREREVLPVIPTQVVFDPWQTQDMAPLQGSWSWMEESLEKKEPVKWAALTVEENHSWSEGLAHLLARAQAWIFAGLQRGFTLEEMGASVWFRLKIGPQFFPELARLRCLRLLWAHLCSAYGTTQLPCPPIWGDLQLPAAPESAHANMIAAGTQALSAVLGGADLLSIPPADAPQGGAGTLFSRRVARNVHHLLQHESHLNHVIDPAAGSYFIENLTQHMGKKAWEQFQALTQAGTYDTLFQSSDPT